MTRNYNIPAILSALTGQRINSFISAVSGQDGEDPEESAAKTKVSSKEHINGTRLYGRDFRGRSYFMPVYIKHKDLEGFSDDPELEGRNMIELQNAVIRVTGTKTIVETPMVGRKGTVKEAVNTNDFKIIITAFVQSQDGTYPTDRIDQIRKLYNIEESVELISAITDLIFDEDHRVVITDIEFPPVPNVEDGQGVIISCVTDKEFELIIPR